MFQIGKHQVGLGRPTLIIAEIGVNHNGSVTLAKDMVAAAKQAGADAVKFQAFTAEKLVTRDAAKADYQTRAGASGKTQLEMLKQLELSKNDFVELKKFSESLDVIFISSVFDEDNLRMLKEIGAEVIKLGSGELTNLPLIREVGRTGLPLILSTGMGDIEEINDAVTAFRAASQASLAILHCTSSYPTPVSEAHILCVRTLAETFHAPTGFSDHTPGTAAAVGAVALGACIIEKHFTTDRTLPGPDQSASATPAELAELVRQVRAVELALGNSEKTLRPIEEDVRKNARRVLRAATDLSAGTKISPEMIVIQRPGDGLLPKHYERLLGKTIVAPMRAGEAFKWEKIK